MHIVTKPMKAPHHIVYFPPSFLNVRMEADFENLPAPYSITSTGMDQVNKKKIQTIIKPNDPENIMEYGLSSY